MATAAEPREDQVRADVPYDRDGLRATVEALAAIPDRGPCSEGERQAAEWIAERLGALGLEARVEEERAFDNYAKPMAALAGIAAAGGALALTRRGRLAGALLGTGVAAAIADDASNGARAFRRATMEQKPTWNVIAEAGDPEAERTLVVIAHHDAAPTGAIFDQTVHHAVADAFPGIIERRDTSIPLWWPAVGTPLLVAAGALMRRRGLALTGLVGSLVGMAVFADIARNRIVPGANDNLSGVAVLVGLAERLAELPVAGLKVLLVSCGSEEVLQGGIYGFGERHFPNLDREQTWMLIVDTVGSPELIMLEGEGAVVMEDYHGRGFRDLIAGAAARARLPLRRGTRARTSTDAVIPSRAGYPTAALSSFDRHKALSNYHWPTDTPDRVNYDTVAAAAAVTEATLRELAEGPCPGAHY